MTVYEKQNRREISQRRIQAAALDKLKNNVGIDVVADNLRWTIDVDESGEIVALDIGRRTTAAEDTAIETEFPNLRKSTKPDLRRQ